MGHNRPLFSLFSSFQYTVDSKQMFNINLNFCQWLDSNRGPLESEATALPPEPQPLPLPIGKVRLPCRIPWAVQTWRMPRREHPGIQTTWSNRWRSWWMSWSSCSAARSCPWGGPTAAGRSSCGREPPCTPWWWRPKNDSEHLIP